MAPISTDIRLLASSAQYGSDHPSQYAANPMPSIEEWEKLWTRWNTVTKDLISSQDLLSQPIKLRNPLIFYLGHIPTFLDIHLTRSTGAALTEPNYYPFIFERGIDPDVDDPERCHGHSEVPDEWPPLHEINDYQQRVRDRVRFILKSGQAETDLTVARALWLGFEHEAMHLETFSYMLLQSDKTIPPPGVPVPDFKEEARCAAAHAVPNHWFHIPAQTLSIGLDEPENHLPLDSFGWDNEKPRRTIQTAAFEAQGRPITNGEYASFLEQTDGREIPASWLAMPEEQQSQNVHENGSSNGTETPGSRLLSDYAVRTIYGPVLLRYAADWPVIASYDQLAQYAAWRNCRLPMFEEAQSIYYYSEQLERSSTQAEFRDAKETNGVNGHKYHAEDTIKVTGSCPDHQPVKKSQPNTRPVYMALDGCNVGFKHWRPTPVTPNGDRLCGHGSMGGVWEWTASPLQPHKGFKAMDVYPGYTADFFDGKHSIVLGGSWATHPRLAGRTTFINWYQRNYPFAWAGARLVRDV